MPLYCFTSKDGETIEELFGMDTAPKSITDNGKKYSRDFGAEHSGKRYRPGHWPQYSEACGTHPKDIVQAERVSHDKGVPTKFTPDGLRIFTSAAHRIKWTRANGLDDR